MSCTVDNTNKQWYTISQQFYRIVVQYSIALYFVLMIITK